MFHAFTPKLDISITLLLKSCTFLSLSYFKLNIITILYCKLHILLLRTVYFKLNTWNTSLWTYESLSYFELNILIILYFKLHAHLTINNCIYFKLNMWNTSRWTCESLPLLQVEAEPSPGDVFPLQPLLVHGSHQKPQHFPDLPAGLHPALPVALLPRHKNSVCANETSRYLGGNGVKINQRFGRRSNAVIV